MYTFSPLTSTATLGVGFESSTGSDLLGSLLGGAGTLAHQLVVAVSKQSPLAFRRVLQLEDLKGMQVYTYRTGTPIGDEVDKLVTRYGLQVHQDYDDEITMGGMISMLDNMNRILDRVTLYLA